MISAWINTPTHKTAYSIAGYSLFLASVLILNPHSCVPLTSKELRWCPEDHKDSTFFLPMSTIPTVHICHSCCWIWSRPKAPGHRTLLPETSCSDAFQQPPGPPTPRGAIVCGAQVGPPHRRDGWKVSEKTGKGPAGSGQWQTVLVSSEPQLHFLGSFSHICFYDPNCPRRVLVLNSVANLAVSRYISAGICRFFEDFFPS